MSAQDSQETMRSTRKTLMTLQHSATDVENLVGRPSKSIKLQLSQDSPTDGEVKRRVSVSSKETQVNIDLTITEDDLTNPEGPSQKYWQVLAEKRQIALQDALEENEKLLKIIEDLKKENVQYKQMLDEANSFVEVIKEELANCSNNDTGIDVNDVSAISTADETVEEDTSSEPKAKASKTE